MKNARRRLLNALIVGLLVIVCILLYYYITKNNPERQCQEIQVIDDDLLSPRFAEYADYETNIGRPADIVICSGAEKEYVWYEGEYQRTKIFQNVSGAIYKETTEYIYGINPYYLCGDSIVITTNSLSTGLVFFKQGQLLLRPLSAEYTLEWFKHELSDYRLTVDNNGTTFTWHIDDFKNFRVVIREEKVIDCMYLLTTRVH